MIFSSRRDHVYGQDLTLSCTVSPPIPCRAHALQELPLLSSDRVKDIDGAQKAGLENEGPYQEYVCFLVGTSFAVHLLQSGPSNCGPAPAFSANPHDSSWADKL